MISVDVKLKGAAETAERLRQLPKKLQKKMLRRGLKNAAKPILKSARTNVPVKSGALKKAIKVRAGKRTKGQLSVVIGPSEKWFVGDYFYAGMVEFGHNIGKRKGSHTENKGAIGKGNVIREWKEGTHYMKNAYEANKDKAKDTLATEVSICLEESITELGGGMKPNG